MPPIYHKRISQTKAHTHTHTHTHAAHLDPVELIAEAVGFLHPLLDIFAFGRRLLDLQPHLQVGQMMTKGKARTARQHNEWREEQLAGRANHITPRAPPCNAIQQWSRLCWGACLEKLRLKGRQHLRLVGGNLVPLTFLKPSQGIAMGWRATSNNSSE